MNNFSIIVRCSGNVLGVREIVSDWMRMRVRHKMVSFGMANIKVKSLNAQFVQILGSTVILGSEYHSALVSLKGYLKRHL